MKKISVLILILFVFIFIFTSCYKFIYINKNLSINKEAGNKNSSSSENLTKDKNSSTDKNIIVDEDAERYFPLSEPQLIIEKGKEGSFDSKMVHTLSVIELNKNGYRFWGYYTGSDYSNLRCDIGLAYSNDLVNWVKEDAQPVVANLRWASAVVVDGIINLFGTRNYEDDTYIVRLVSEDGRNFTEVETVVGSAKGEKHQNAFIFYDEKDSMYRLYYFHLAGKVNYIMEKHSKNINSLSSASPNIVLTDENNILAAPSVLYASGRYWLTAETAQLKNNRDIWKTLVFVSDSPISGFKPAANHELLVNGDACYFQYIFDNKLYGFYSHEYIDRTWELYMCTSDLESKGTVLLLP